GPVRREREPQPGDRLIGKLRIARIEQGKAGDLLLCGQVREADAGADMRRHAAPPGGHVEIVDRIAEEGESLCAARGFRVARRDDLGQPVAAVVELAFEAPRSLLDAEPAADVEAL